MVDRIVGYRVAAGALAVVAVFSWIGFARAARDLGSPRLAFGLWLAVAVSATVFSAATTAVASVASLLLLRGTPVRSPADR